MIRSSIFRLHFIVFLWGFTAIIGKLISSDAYSLVFYRMFFASIILFLFQFFFAGENLKIPKTLLFQLSGIGLIIAVHWCSFFYSIKTANVSIALSCLSLATLFSAFLEPIIFRKRVDFTEVIIGVIVALCISFIFGAEFQYKKGIIAGIICAFLGSLFSVLNGKMFGKTSSTNIIFYEMLGGTIFLSLTLIITGKVSVLKEVKGTDFSLIALLASLLTAYPMLESVRLMKYISPFTLTLTINLEPVYGIILAHFIFGASEHMTPVFYISSLVMVLSILTNTYIKTRKKSKKIIPKV
ncbi:MAG: DMT family transporter [Bergeyella sp.]|nr:DMT family transporter [Bergeyella sp.]